MLSPASTGLLPASYSRRRRSRPNVALMDSVNSTAGYREVLDVEIPPGAHHQHQLGSASPRRSPTHKKKLYSFHGSDSENDENDEGRINNTRKNRPCPYEEGYEDVLPKPPPLSDFLVNDRNYQSYLIEGRNRGALAYRGLRGRGVLESNGRSWYSEPAFLAKFCAGWSFVGMSFLVSRRVFKIFYMQKKRLVNVTSTVWNTDIRCLDDGVTTTLHQRHVAQSKNIRRRHV